MEGARLAALAAGRPVPLPHQDPDVLAALRTALATEPLISQAALTTPGQVITDPAEPDLGWPGSSEDIGWLGGAPGGGAPGRARRDRRDRRDRRAARRTGRAPRTTPRSRPPTSRCG